MARKSSKSSGSLFENESQLLFATNRANVLPILSSGLIRPRAAYDKYYEDLLSLSSGHLPLWRGGFPASLVPLVTGQEQGMFPVLVAIDPKQLANAARPRILHDLTMVVDKLKRTAQNTLCELFSEPLPISCIKALYFASQDNLDDFQARDFNNILALPPLEVKPSAFIKAGPDPEKFKDALKGVSQAAGTSNDFRNLDSAMGAVAMMALTLPNSMPWLEAFSAGLSFPRSGKALPTGQPLWLASLVQSVMTTGNSVQSGTDIDGRLLRSAIECLRESNPRDGWVEAKVVTDIATRASTGADPQQIDEIETWRNVVNDVARADKSAGSLTDSGSLIRRGLMLLVLRCQPERIIKAHDSPLRPGPKVTAIASMLSGLFHGYSRLSRDLKSSACDARLLSRIAICWWSSVDGVPRKVSLGTSTRQDDPTTIHHALTVDSTPFVEKTFRPDDAMMRLYYHAKAEGYVFEYDPSLNAFIHLSGKGTAETRRIIIEPGLPTSRGKPTIRVRTTCLHANGKPVSLSKREEAVSLLEHNHNPETQCRFAVEPGTGNVEVLVHQILETMDSPELQSHIEAVTTTVDVFEKSQTDQSSARRRSGKSSAKLTK